MAFSVFERIVIITNEIKHSFYVHIYNVFIYFSLVYPVMRNHDFGFSGFI